MDDNNSVQFIGSVYAIETLLMSIKGSHDNIDCELPL